MPNGHRSMRGPGSPWMVCVPEGIGQRDVQLKRVTPPR
jgi:hypothetical protein